MDNTINISIFPKDTNAKTQFYEIDQEPEDYLYFWMSKFVCEMAEMCTVDEDLRRELHRRRPNTFPKSKRGPNSILGFAGGMCANKLNNPKKNISEPQLEGIENLFRIMSAHYTGSEQTGKYTECLPVKFKAGFFTNT